MIIHCTKKLLDQLKIKPAEAVDEIPLFSWHANIIMVNHRKTMVLVNDRNRYNIILYGLKAKDFKNLDQIMIQAIRETLLEESVKAEIVDQFIHHSPGITYAKTKNRTLVARMNKACEYAHSYADALNTESMIQSEVSRKSSSMLVGEGKNDYFQPNEEMYLALETFAKEPIFRCEFVELLVTLDLEHHPVWRKIIVPTQISFRKLHQILQITFDWKEYHLHDFYVLDRDKPIIHLVSSEEAFAYPDEVPMSMETDKKIADYIPEYTTMRYTYDFGDDWQHTIEVGRIIENHTKNYPECLEGKGDTPPEDVGGEGGYEAYLEAVSDPEHPEHSSMTAWANSQFYMGFDIKRVNRRLKNVMIGT